MMEERDQNIINIVNNFIISTKEIFEPFRLLPNNRQVLCIPWEARISVIIFKCVLRHTQLLTSIPWAVRQRELVFCSSDKHILASSVTGLGCFDVHLHRGSYSIYFNAISEYRLIKEECLKLSSAIPGSWHTVNRSRCKCYCNAHAPRGSHTVHIEVYPDAYKTHMNAC